MVNATLGLCKLIPLWHEKATCFAGTKLVLMNIRCNEMGAGTCNKEKGERKEEREKTKPSNAE